MHEELLPPGNMIDSGFYCQQLPGLQQAASLELVKGKGGVFLH